MTKLQTEPKMQPQSNQGRIDPGFNEINDESEDEQDDNINPVMNHMKPVKQKASPKKDA